MIIKEYRIVLPISVEEFKIAQLYTFAEASKNETGGGEGVEVCRNEPFWNVPLVEGGKASDGQFTHKVYRIQSKVPGWLRAITPQGSLEFHEEAWNAYPLCKTEFSNPAYMKENFRLTIQTLHLPDRGGSPNVHNLSPDKLKKREVVHVDIANDEINPKALSVSLSYSLRDYREKWDPQKFRSVKTNRGPLIGPWQDQSEPVMCCYKLVTVEFKWFPVGPKIESFIHKSERRLFLSFHRQLFCSIDEWSGLTMANIRKLEEETKADLDKQRNHGDIRSHFLAFFIACSNSVFF
ncbi:Phosphatidylinositol transfer protein alpha isoform [Hypsibius exemplaris]|uniref:Phosphatidylinositol transfer protein alpha isoform n=1 Tax=Hypsibius exemplaris TaxID=2072580 RepID=A0A1W0WTB2_HYPEX|nr:Phosphatidylinositol transfer protein alpha isoform [Hypsibius exemplaris]